VLGLWLHRARRTPFCPCAAKPEIKGTFDATHKDFQEQCRARMKKTNDKRKSSNISTILSTPLQDKDQLNQLKALLSAKNPRMAASPSQEFVTFPTFLCLLTVLTSKPLLPISVDSNLPRFLLPIGQATADTAFKISVAYDTCAVLNAGWAGFHLAITKQYSHLVKSLVWVKEQYTPLILLGVVSHIKLDPSKAEKLVTTLPAVVKYYMPIQANKGIPLLSKLQLVAMLQSMILSSA
jgi:hypothetical protein